MKISVVTENVAREGSALEGAADAFGEKEFGSTLSRVFEGMPGSRTAGAAADSQQRVRKIQTGLARAARNLGAALRTSAANYEFNEAELKESFE